MKFTVLSRKTAQTYRPKGPAALISIVDPESEEMETDHSYDHAIYLRFHDIDRTISGYTTFDYEDAKFILEFYKAHRDVDEFVIHCGAGISRSAAVAAALSKIHTGDDMEFYGGRFIPNSLVYSMILYQRYGTTDARKHGPPEDGPQRAT